MSCCSKKDDRLWWGLVAFVVGAVVLLQRFDVVPAETWNYLWPSILIVSGLKWMLAGDACAGGSCDTKEMSGMCGDCGNKPCSCDMMPMTSKAKKPAVKKAKRK